MTLDLRKDPTSGVVKEFAPYPGDGFAVYAIVAVATFSVGLFFFGKFYSVDILEHPFLVLAGGGLTICLLSLLRWQRIRRHKIDQN